MPQEFDSPDSPFIRISRNGESARAFPRDPHEVLSRDAAGRNTLRDEEDEYSQTAAGYQSGNRRSGNRPERVAAAGFSDFGDEEGEASFSPRREPARRTRGSRPMPKRLSEEQEELEREMYEREAAATTQEEEEEVVPAPRPKKRASKTNKAKAKQETAEQLPLELKAPRKKPDNVVKQRQVLGLAFITMAVLVFLAIISYTPNDAAQAETKLSDLPAIFTRSNPQVNANADTVHNWLGLMGAMLADFLINKTIGYAAIIYPIFFGWWSLALFKFTTKQRRRLTLATSFFLVTAILFSATIGTTQLIPSLPTLSREWSGAVGQFMGITFTRLIGAVGALIVYAIAFVITLIFSIDLDIERTFHRVKGYYNTLITTGRRKWVEYQEHRAQKLEEKRLLAEQEEEEEDEEDLNELESVTSDDVQDENITVKKTSSEVKAEVKAELKQEIKQETKQEAKAKRAIQKPAEEVKAALAKSVVPEETEDIDTTKDILANAGASQESATAAPAKAEPVKILRTAAVAGAVANAAGLAASSAKAQSAVAAGSAMQPTSGAVNPAAVPPTQPQLKVRPIPKEGQGIPRLTRPTTDKLGDKQAGMAKLSNGAIEPPKPQTQQPLDLLSKTEQPIQEDRVPELQENISASEELQTPHFSKDELLEDVLSDAARENVVATAPIKPEQKIEIRKDAPVILGDERTVSAEALPHSMSVEEDLIDVVKEHQALSRQVAREIDKAKAENGLFEQPEQRGPKVIIPENPYNEILNKYRNPSFDILTQADPKDEIDADDEELAMKGRLLRDKLATFGVEIENITVTPGPVVTLYEFTPAEGVKVSRVESLTDDIALAMKARGIRIIAPIPGRGTIGVEIPNDIPKMVRIRSLFESPGFRQTKMNLPLALGKTISGDVYVDDLNKMPHLLIAGATGAGKSVGVNGIIASLLYAKSPKDVKFVIVDPKKIELSLYKKLRKHYLIVSPEAGEDIVTTPQFAVLALKAVELEMEKRYDKLAKAAVRSLSDYNQKVAQGKLQSTQDEQHYHLPYIVVIIDELADLMITAAREIEEPICRIAQMARAVGIHLILATQRPSVDVITGVIKANFPARIAFQVATRVDSRTILDTMGAEQLLGNGDMLYQPSGTPKPIRLQSPFISTEEVEAMIDAIAEQDGNGLSYSRPWTLPSLKQKGGGGASVMEEDSRDDLFEEAAKIIVRHQQGSVSLLQRRLKVGYSRAARIVDELEQAGIVGPFDGSKARQVLCESMDELMVVLEGLR